MAETAQQRNARQKREADERDTRRREADAKAATARADADARQAEAQARATEAQARADAARAEAAAKLEAQRQADAEAQRVRDADKARREQQTLDSYVGAGMTAAAIAVGMTTGKIMAGGITKKVEASAKARNAEINALAAKIDKTMAPPSPGAPLGSRVQGPTAPGQLPSKAIKASLRGAVAAADKLGLANRPPRALGLTMAAAFVGEAALTRFVIAPRLEGAARETANAAAAGFLVAATSLVGKRLIDNAAPKVPLPAASIASIESARAMVEGGKAGATAAKPSLVARVVAAVKGVPKSKAAAIATVAGATGAALGMGATTAKAAEGTAPTKQAEPGTIAKATDVALSTATTVQAARLASSPAARAAAGFLGKLALPIAAAQVAYGAYQGYQKTGTVAGAAMGAADGATGGLASMAVDWAQGGKGGTPAPAPDVATSRLAMMQGAAGRAAAEMGATTTLGQGQTGAAALPATDGRTDDYYRVQNGKTVRVQGYSAPGR